MRTFRHESGLMPSVFGESGGLTTVTAWIVTLSHASGLIVHMGEFFSVIPLICTLRQSTTRTRIGRRATPGSLRCDSHQICPRPSIVPRPVIAMFSNPSPQISAAREIFTPGPSHLLDH